MRTRQQTSSPPESRRGMGNAGSLSATPSVRRSRSALPTLGQPRSTVSTDNPTPARLRPRIGLSASCRPPQSRAVVPTAHFLRPVRSNTLELGGQTHAQQPDVDGYAQPEPPDLNVAISQPALDIVRISCGLTASSWPRAARGPPTELARWASSALNASSAKPTRFGLGGDRRCPWPHRCR